MLGALLPPIGAQKHRAASAPMPAEGERAASPKSLSRRTSEDDRQSHKDIKLMFNQMKPRLTATSAADKVPRNGCNIRPPTASRSSTHSCHPSWADANRVIESLQALVLNHSLEEQIESPRLRSAAAAAACGAAASRSARVSRDSSMRGDNDAAAVAAAAAGGEPTDIGMQDFMEFMVSRRLSGQDVDTGAAASVKVPSKLTVESLVGGSRRDSTALAVAEPVVPPLEWSRSLPELNPSAPSTRRSRSTSASDRLAAAAPAPLSFGDSAGDLYHITLNPNAAANGTGNSGSVRALSRRSTGDSLGLGMPPVPEASDLPYMHDLLTSFDPSALQSQIGHSQLFEEAPRLSAPQRQSSSASQLSWATTAGRPRGKPYFSPELIAKMRMVRVVACT